MTYSSLQCMQSPNTLIDHFHHLKILKAPDEFSISLKFLRSCVPSHLHTDQPYKNLDTWPLKHLNAKNRAPCIFQLCYLCYTILKYN